MASGPPLTRTRAAPVKEEGVSVCVLLPAAQDPALTRRLCTALAVILARAERTPECGTWIVYGPLGRVANPGVSRAAYPQPSAATGRRRPEFPGAAP